MGVVSAFQQFGPLLGPAYLVQRILSSISHDARLLAYDLVAQPVPEKPLLSGARAEALTWCELEPGDQELTKVIAPPAIQAMRFDQGATCLGIYRRGEMIGYVWLCDMRYEEDEARCTYEVPRGATFDFDLVILPEHRNTLAFASLWHATFEYLRLRGIAVSYSRISRFNLPSCRAHERLGAQRIGRMMVLKLWRLEVLAASIAPRLALSLSRQVGMSLSVCNPTLPLP